MAIHAYVLMSNHVHQLVTSVDEHGVSRMMQALGRRYVQYFNARYERSGTLWEGRYRSTLVDSETYLLTVYRYPVRAGMVSHPSYYPWSSYAFNVIGRPDKLITSHECYQVLGTDSQERQEAYRVLFHRRIPESDIRQIRSATNQAWLLGSDRFKQDFERRTGRPAYTRKRGGDRRSDRWKKGNQRL